MKKLIAGIGLAAMCSLPMTASADWFNNGPWNGNGWNNGYNDWPEWTPMYWAQEMMDCMDDNGNGCFNNNGYYGSNYGPNYAPNPYYAPYGYAPMPAPNAGQANGAYYPPAYGQYPMPPQGYPMPPSMMAPPQQ